MPLNNHTEKNHRTPFLKWFAAVVLGAVLAVLLSTHVVQGRLKSYYLGNARIVGTITWSEAFLAHKTISTEEPNARCIRIGKDQINGQMHLYVFTPLTMYEFQQDERMTWRLKDKGPYSD
jgi:hypothetical protein